MSYNKTKTDPELGQQVHEHLVKMGVETPIKKRNLDRKDQIDIIEGNFAEIMRALGLDLTDDSLMDTPKRVAKMYVNEIFWGLDYDAFPKCTTVDNKMIYNPKTPTDTRHYLYEGERVTKSVTEKFEANHGFTLIFLPGRNDSPPSEFTDITEIFKLIRKYVREVKLVEMMKNDEKDGLYEK